MASDPYTTHEVFPLAGVALFDDPGARGDGWACIAGESGFRISGTGDLNSSVVWLTNVDYRAFETSGLRGSRRYRRSNYLRTQLNRIASELGVIPYSAGVDEARGREAAEALAQFFASVMEIAWRIGVGGYPIYQLRQGFRDLIVAPAEPTAQREIVAALADSFQAYTISESANPLSKEQSEYLSVTLHRTTHAKTILTQPVPSGGWRRSELRDPGAIIDSAKPLLVNVEFHGGESRISRLLNFGGAGKTGDGGSRRWIPLPEFGFMYTHANCTVLDVMEAREYVQNPMVALLDNFDFLQDISPAFQIVAESIWSSCMVTSNGRADRGGLGSWVAAYDRLECMIAALDLMDRSDEIDIASFGYGRIAFKTRKHGPDTARWLSEVLAGTHLIPPVIPGAALENVQMNEDNPASLLRATALLDQVELLVGNDHAAMEDWDKQATEETAT